jgi:SAM-dependent methyltransferase
LHTKHKHIKYHDFFVQRIEPESRILDVDCGNGALAYDIATQVAEVSVYGIDSDPVNIKYARQNYSAGNIRFVCGDALGELPEQHIDVIVLSNVLEHIKKRVDFLRGLQERYQPQKFLIRVPIFERDWRVPLKEELGIDYRLDPTHYIEYRQDEFVEEIARAGLWIRYSQINWGEIWAELVTYESSQAKDLTQKKNRYEEKNSYRPV